jgi:hypothetical protein
MRVFFNLLSSILFTASLSLDWSEEVLAPEDDIVMYLKLTGRYSTESELIH